MNSPFLSIVIPIWQEESRVEACVRDILSFFNTVPFNWECILSLEKSNDRTLELAKKFSENRSIKILELNQHKGKGFALRSGLSLAQGEWIVTLNAGLGVPLTEIVAALEVLESAQADLCVGNRYHPASKIYASYPKSRERVESFISSFAQSLFFADMPDMTDPQCPFKVYRRRAVAQILPQLRSTSYEIETEIVACAKGHGLKIVSKPIQWRARPGSHFRILKDSFKLWWNLLEMSRSRQLRLS